MKIRPVEAELFHADRTDRQTERNGEAFRNFVNASENIEVTQGRYFLHSL